MTTFHAVDLSWIGVCGDTPQERAEQDKILIRGSAAAAAACNAAVFIYEKRGFWGDDEENPPIAAIIPAGVAKDLIREGRLNRPPVASLTVLARDSDAHRHEEDELGDSCE